MTDLIVLPQTNQWQKLKALVLDSVSSPITCTLTPVSDVNVCPTVSATGVRSSIGAVAFCACPSGPDAQVCATRWRAAIHS